AAVPRPVAPWADSLRALPVDDAGRRTLIELLFRDRRRRIDRPPGPWVGHGPAGRVGRPGRGAGPRSGRVGRPPVPSEVVWRPGRDGLLGRENGSQVVLARATGHLPG